MGKSTPSAPAAPDPVATAQAQTQSNIATANANANLNHSNQITPYGSQIWSSTPNADGTSSWTSTISLSPDQQKLLDSSNSISQSLANLGQSQLGTVANSMSQPFNYNNAPQQVTSVASPAMQSSVNAGDLTNSAQYGNIQNDVDLGGANLYGTFQDAQKAAYNQQAAYLDPQYKQAQNDLETQLVNQGVVQGSDAWNKATQNLGLQRTSAYNNAFNNSFSTGLAAQNQLYNQALSNGQFHNAAQAQGFGQSLSNAQLNNAAQSQKFGQDMSNAQLGNSTAQQTFSNALTNANLQNAGRTQAINEANYLRQQPLNELNALRTGSQVTAPQFGSTPQTSVNPTDIAGLYNQQYQGQLAQYNAGVASNNALTGGLFNLGSTALMYASDRRLKENIERVGTRPDGLGIYDFDYKPEFKDDWGHGRYRGVMADEVEAVMPHAVVMHPAGYKVVNYGALNG